MAKYRKKTGSDTWHYCSNCSKWPTKDYSEQANEPSSGEKCNECRAKVKDGNCKS